MKRPAKQRKKTRRKQSSARRHADDLLDEALEESFPASDPPQMTEPNGKLPVRARKRRKRKR